MDMDNTLVIVTADHGENLGEAGRWGHLFAVNDNLIRVPLLIQYPKRFPAGKRVSGLCQLTDLVPTVFDVIERPCPVNDLPGRSIVPEKFTPMPAAFAQWWPQLWGLRIIQDTLGRHALLEPWMAEYRVIRTDKHKYVWSSDGRHQLYDIVADPSEATNLITTMPDLATSLNAELMRWWDTQRAYQPKVTDGGTPMDAETLESLKSLGYVGE
jgi:arylsulfatase A-like enzyme